MARRKRSFVTKYPAHHEVVDSRSRRLTGKSPRLLLAIANKMLGERLIEKQVPPQEELAVADLKDRVNPAIDGIHEVDRRVEAEMIGRCQSLRPLWHGRA